MKGRLLCLCLLVGCGLFIACNEDDSQESQNTPPSDPCQEVCPEGTAPVESEPYMCASTDSRAPMEYRAMVAQNPEECDEEIPQRIAQEGAPKLDVLLVVDNSGSMRDEQEGLRKNFAAFMEGLGEQGELDFQIGVITTDVDPNNIEGPFAGRLMHSPARVKRYSTGWETNMPWLGECPDELPPFICSDPEQPPYTQGGCYVPPEEMDLVFGCLVTTGMCSSCGFEKGLEAVRLALSPPLIQNENAGFLRSDAALSVIIVSDENDCSDDGVIATDNGNNCEWGRDQLVPTETYVDFLQGLKPHPSMVTFSAIVGADDPWDRNNDFQSLAGEIDNPNGANGKRLRYNRPDDFATTADYTCYEGPDTDDPSIYHVCVDNVRPACMSSLGQAFPGYRYIEVTQAFGANGVWSSLCTPDLNQPLKASGATASQSIKAYYAAFPPH